MRTLRNIMIIKLKGKTSIIFIAIIQNFTPNTIIPQGELYKSPHLKTGKRRNRAVGGVMVLTSERHV